MRQRGSPVLRFHKKDNADQARKVLASKSAQVIVHRVPTRQQHEHEREKQPQDRTTLCRLPERKKSRLRETLSAMRQLDPTIQFTGQRTKVTFFQEARPSCDVIQKTRHHTKRGNSTTKFFKDHARIETANTAERSAVTPHTVDSISQARLRA